jgi:hypothetical protein
LVGCSGWGELTIEEEIRVLAEEAQRLGGVVDRALFDRQLETARRGRAELRERLPIGTPDDLWLVGSTCCSTSWNAKSARPGAGSTRTSTRTLPRRYDGSSSS